MTADDPTLDPELRSWVEVPPGSDFPIQNLPLGIFRGAGRHEAPRAGVAIGERVLDLAALQEAGLLAEVPNLPVGVFAQPSLNGFLSCGKATWRALRGRISQLLSEGDPTLRNAGVDEVALLPFEEITLDRPIEPTDFVDFYSSIEHATNMGRMFRPDQEPLLPNWRWMPIGYHGRAGTVVASGTPIRRPSGQLAGGDGPPEHGPTRALDIELEMGFVTGPANDLGIPIPIGSAREHIFGLVLVNDWSARDIQAFEYQPLGPFLGKSFATSISSWVVSLDALEPYRVASREQDPKPLPHLRTEADGAYDVQLQVSLQPPGGEEVEVSRGNLRGIYWTIAQQLTHATSNGATAQPGDLFASGTISGAERGTEGSLIELTRRGAEPITLTDGSTRAFLQDGDTVVLRGWCESAGRPRIGFGEVRGTIVPA